jgi:hypothetical protein
MARLPVPGQDNGAWGEILNDFLSQSLSANGSLKPGVVTSSALAPGAVTVTKADVGLAVVDNTTDLGKPVSTATQTALNLKAPVASPTFTGVVTVPTPSNGTDATTKTYVDTTTIPLSQKGAANGVATLTGTGKLTASQAPDLSGSYATASAVGVTIPRGSLDRWKAARANVATTRADIVWFGDSTSHGQTSNGDAAASANNHPITQAVRGYLVAAGYADGGVGIRGWNASAAMSGSDNLAHVVSSTPGSGGGTWTTGTSGFYGGLFNNSICTTGATNNTGGTVTIQGKGRYCRINDVTGSTTYAAWSYAVDGGSATTVAIPVSGGRRPRTTVIDCGGSDGTTHTIVITITADGTFECVAAWLNSKGIAVNNLSLPGQKLSGRFDSTQTQQIQSAPFLGLGDNVVVTDAISANKTGPWAPALAILHMGINEQILGSTDQATALTSSATLRQGIGVFAEMCRTADVDALVCIPHLAYGANARQYQGLYRSAIYDAAISFGCAVADLQIPLGNTKSSYNVGVHLAAAGYDAQAQWLVTNVLNA